MNVFLSGQVQLGYCRFDNLIKMRIQENEIMGGLELFYMLDGGFWYVDVVFF